MKSYAHICLNGAALGDIAYRSWWGAPLISNRDYRYEELRFQHRAVDDASYREWYQRVNEMVRILC